MSSNPPSGNALPETGGGESGSSSEFEFIDNASKKLPPPSPLPVFTSEPVIPTENPERKLSSSSSPTSLVKYEDTDDIMSSLGLGWISTSSGNGGLFSKMAQKTKSSFETVITTLDPQMKEYLNGKNRIPHAPDEIVIASDQNSNVIPISNAFRGVFGSRTAVYGLPSKTKTIATQPVGFAAGRQGAKERMSSLLESFEVIVAVENFLLEVGEDTWTEMSVLMLFNSKLDISLTTYSQPVCVDVQFVDIAKEATPDTYPQKWSGLQKSIGGIIGDKLGTNLSDWHSVVTGGTTREEILFLAAETLAKMYKKVLCERVEAI